MKSFKKKVAALVIILTAITLAVPFNEFNEVYASSFITKSGSVNAYDYTSSPVLAKKLTQVFNGSVGLYSNSNCTNQVKAPLGCSKLNGSNRFYIKNGTTGSKTFGWQCYIYANAVYNTLFNEWAGNGTSYKHSKVVIRGGSSFSYRQFVNAGVRVGAYVRTTANRDCSYNRSKAHSFVILGYNEEYVTYIDGNSDGRGLVRVNKMTWKELNKWQTTGRGRRICHVVQPTDKYFNSLYGAKNALSGSSKTEENTAVTVTKEASVNSASAAGTEKVSTAKNETSKTTVDPDKIKVKYKRMLSYKKSSKVLSGNDVLYIQTALKYLGYSVNTNAKYDSNTFNVVKKFQKAKKLTANGILGKQTWAALESAVKAKKIDSKKVTVKFNANGGTSAPSSQKVEPNKATTLTKSIPVRSGYDFNGWSLEKKSDKVDYKPGAKITVKENTTLYAVWTAQEFKIVTQPKDLQVKPGVKVTLKIGATGVGLTYKWYYKKAGETEWTYWPKHDCASSLSTPNKTWDEMDYYCVVTNADGETLSSEIAHTVVVK